MRVLFITSVYRSPLYNDLQQNYAVETAGVAPNFKTAVQLLMPDDLPEAVIIGHDMLPPDQTVEFVRKAMSQSKLRDLKWIVLLDRNAAFVQSELQGLCNTVVFQDTTAANLADLLKARTLQSKQTTALAVLNIKGGTGKTSMIVNLADALARQGLQTVIIDADVADGNVALALSMPPAAPTIDKMAREIAQGKEAHRIIEHYLYKHNDNLYILAAPDRRDYDQDFLNEVSATAIFNAITARRFEVILIDLPGNVRATPFTTVLAEQPCTYFYLLYPVGQTFGVKGFDGAMQIVSGLGARDRARIVALERRDGDPWSESELQRAWQIPVVGKLPYDASVEKSQTAGQTIFDWQQAQKGIMSKLVGGPPYLKAIEDIARWIVTHDLSGEVNG